MEQQAFTKYFEPIEGSTEKVNKNVFNCFKKLRNLFTCSVVAYAIH